MDIEINAKNVQPKFRHIYANSVVRNLKVIVKNLNIVAENVWDLLIEKKNHI